MSDNTREKVKKQSAVRTWFQAAWFVLTNSYLRGYGTGTIFTGNTKVICLPGLNCYSCPGALGACPMGALQAVMGDSTYRISLYVFGMLAAMGALFGRLICGWMCPFGFFQDLLYKIPVKIKKKILPGHKYLKYLKYVILVVFPILLVSIVTDLTGTSSPWFCEWICPSGMLLGAIPLVTMNAGLRAAAGLRFAWKLFILIAITVLSLIYYRPFCKYLCPLGAVYSLFNPISSYRLVIDKDKCVSCGTCQKACGMDIRTFETPNSLECIRCGSCMKACPTNAISSTWGQAGQKIKRRCFVDEETIAARDSQASVSLTRKTVFYGLVSIITALASLVGTVYVGLFTNMKAFMTVDLYQEMNSMYLVTFLLWSIASVMLLFTGIFAVRSRKDTEAIISIKEKARIALFFGIAGIPFMIGGIVLNVETLMSYFQPALFSASFFAAIPLALILSGILRRFARDEQAGETPRAGRKAAWVIWSVLYVLNIAVTPALLALLYSLTLVA